MEYIDIRTLLLIIIWIKSETDIRLRGVIDPITTSQICIIPDYIYICCCTTADDNLIAIIKLT